ncbi:MAG: hypothetical protein Q9200_002214 [Gallowayella weberi]
MAANGNRLVAPALVSSLSEQQSQINRQVRATVINRNGTSISQGLFPEPYNSQKSKGNIDTSISITARLEMAEQQRHRQSQPSSSNSSRTYMTPSETLLSPPGTMLDISEHASSGLPDMFTPSSSDITTHDEAWPVVSKPDTPLVFEHQSMGEPTSRPEHGQDEWAAVIRSQIGVQCQAASWPQSDIEPSLAADLRPAFNQGSYHFPHHRMNENLAAFEQAYRDDKIPDQRPPPTINTDDTPRYIPWSIDAAVPPWTPWDLIHERWARHPRAQDLLYEPAMDLYLAGPHDQSLVFRERFTQEPNHNVFSGLDRYRVGSVIPEDNIDPPPRPDPIGPPSQLIDESSSCAHKAVKAKVNGGRRYQPLSPDSRQKAKMTRRNQADLKVKPLVHLSLKLVVLTYIMTHSLTLVEDTKDTVYEQLWNPPGEKFGHHTCARLVNKQFKFLLSPLHRDLLKNVLNKVQQNLRSSDKKKVFWAPLFACMVILAMTIETLQVSVRCKEQTDKQEGTIDQDDKTADKAIAEMDDRYDFLKNLFHQGYRTLQPKGLNPLRCPQDRGRLEDGASQSLAAKASDIVEHYRKFIQCALFRQLAEAMGKVLSL